MDLSNEPWTFIYNVLIRYKMYLSSLNHIIIMNFMRRGETTNISTFGGNSAFVYK